MWWAQGELVRNAESQPPPHPPSTLHSLPANLHSNWSPLIPMYINVGQLMLFNVKYINTDDLLLKWLQISLDTYFKMFSQITLIGAKMLQHLIMVNDLMQRNIMQRVCPLSHKKCPCPDPLPNLISIPKGDPQVFQHGVLNHWFRMYLLLHLSLNKAVWIENLNN